MTSSKRLDFGKDKTLCIKGLAIVLMVIHHTFPNAGAYKICVGIFAFMVCYGYFFASRKSILSGIKRSYNLLKTFWFVLFLLILPIAVWGGYHWTASNILTNMIGVEINLNWYSWFLKYYIIAMISLPAIHKIIIWRPVFGSILSITLCYVAICIIHELTPATTNIWWKLPFDSLLYMPITILGYLFDERKLYQRISIHSEIPAYTLIITDIILIIMGIGAKYLIPGISIINFELIYVPLIILGVLLIFNSIESKWIKRIFTELGEKSMWMWWIHALFFTSVTAWFYVTLINFAKISPYIFTLWIIILSFIFSVSIDYGYNLIINSLSILKKHYHYGTCNKGKN